MKFGKVGAVALCAIACASVGMADSPALTEIGTFATDVGGLGTTIATKVGTAAAAAVVLFGSFMGLRMILKAFGFVGKKG